MILNKIPDKVKIGCFEYDVILTDEPIIIGDNCNYNGCIDYNEQIIKIKKTMPESLQIQVLIEYITKVLLTVVGDNVDKGTIENKKRE